MVVLRVRVNQPIQATTRKRIQLKFQPKYFKKQESNKLLLIIILKKKFLKKFCTLVNVNNPKREQKSAAFAVGYFLGN